MILTLMRHPPIDAESERCIGQTDVELSPEGRTALLPLAEEACHLGPDKILCSDLKRCRLLAEAIAARLGLFAEPDPIWREVSFGTWENRTWSDIQAREPQLLNEWIANFNTVAPPAGESFEQLQARVLTAVEGKIVGSKCDTGVSPVNLCKTRVPPVPQSGLSTSGTPVSHYLVITHAGVIRAAVSAFSGLPLRKAFEPAVPYGSHTSFFGSGNHWSLVDLVTARRTLLQESAL